MGGGWVVDGSLASRDGRTSSKNETPPVCFLFHTRSSRTNQLTAPRVPGVLLYVLLHYCTAVCSKGLVGGWVEGALRCPWWVGGVLLFCLFSTYIQRMIQHHFFFLLGAGVLLYVLLHCYTAVCSKGLAGGWVEGALRRPWWVGGPFRTWESFFVLWEMNLFCVSKIPASRWCLGVPPSPLLHSSVLYYRRTYCCTAVLLPCYYFVILVLTYRA